MKTRLEAPKAFLDILAYTPVTPSDAQTSEHLTAEQLKTLLTHIDVYAHAAHDEWLSIAMASHSATGGSLEALAVFQEWSGGNNQFSNLADEVSTRWESFSSMAGGVTVGTLFKFAREASAEGDFAVRMIQGQLEFEVEDPGEEPFFRERVVDDFNEETLADEVILRLAKREGIYQRARQLLEVAADDEGFQVICPVTKGNLRGVISGTCDLGAEVYDKENDSWAWKSKRIPDYLVSQVNERPEYPGVSYLSRVVNAPAFLESGEVMQREGYDKGSRIFFDPKGVEFPRAKEKPTKTECEEAAKRLLDVVCDFPFAGDAHKSMYLAAVLTMLARDAINGPCPLFFIAGNTKGVGKTLLVNTIATMTNGRFIDSGPYPRSNAEATKTVLPLLERAAPGFMFDNVPNNEPFGYPVFDALLTSQTWSDRVLGKSEVRTYQVKTVFYATGNGLNISKGSDISRRLAYLKLDFQGEDPQSRTTYKHGSEYQFRLWLEENRAQLVCDALTVLRGFHVAGRPAECWQAWGSFNEWVSLIANCICWLGLPSPLETQAEMKEEVEDEGRDDLKTIVEGVKLICGADWLTTSQLLESASGVAQFVEGGENALEAFQELVFSGGDRSVRRLGRVLSSAKDKTVDGWRIKKKRVRGVSKYSAIEV